MFFNNFQPDLNRWFVALKNEILLHVCRIKDSLSILILSFFFGFFVLGPLFYVLCTRVLLF